MNDDVRRILNVRATLINNLDGLLNHGIRFNKDRNQLSLFGPINNTSVELKEPNEINYEGMLKGEKDSLGIYLTYNPFEEHVLVSKKFCNNDIESLQYLTNDYDNKLVILARINEIKHKKSAAGNSYAKLIIEDATSSCMVYLWGKKYAELIPELFLDRIYLIELGYKKDGNTLFVVNIRKAEEVPIQKIIKKITLCISDIEDIPTVRKYVFSNMIGSNYSLYFEFGGETFEAPYRVNFNSDDYHFLKEFITDIKI